MYCGMCLVGCLILHARAAQQDGKDKSGTSCTPIPNRFSMHSAIKSIHNHSLFLVYFLGMHYCQIHSYINTTTHVLVHPPNYSTFPDGVSMDELSASIISVSSSSLGRRRFREGNNGLAISANSGCKLSISRRCSSC